MWLLRSRKTEKPQSEEELEHPSGASPASELWAWFKLTASALVIVILVHQYLFHLSAVKGASMQPTLLEGEWLFINKTIRFTGMPNRGDVVVLREPTGTDELRPYLVKRVVAVAGDEVHIRRGKLFVNGNEMEEPYTDSLIQDGRFEPFTVEEGFIFVMGDNRRRYASNDSRSFGAVPISLVEGRAEWIVWPVAQWRSL